MIEFYRHRGGFTANIRLDTYTRAPMSSENLWRQEVPHMNLMNTCLITKEKKKLPNSKVVAAIM